MLSTPVYAFYHSRIVAIDISMLSALQTLKMQLVAFNLFNLLTCQWLIINLRLLCATPGVINIA